MCAQRRDHAGQRQERIVAKVDDCIVTDDVDRKMRKVDGDRRSDLNNVVARESPGLKLLMTSCPDVCFKTKVSPPALFMTSFVAVEVNVTPGA